MATFLCTPNTSWANATSASVEGIDPPRSAVNLPVDHREPDTYDILRSEYEDGVVVIPIGHEPAAGPALLPGIVSAGSSVELTLDPEDPQDMPWGGTVLFVD